MKNLSEIMQQAQAMQAKMGEMQTMLDGMDIEGQAGAGMISVRLNGKGEMRGVSIDPSLFSAEEKEVVEDLIIAAYNDAKSKVETRVQEEMAKMQAELGLPPGMKLPF